MSLQMGHVHIVINLGFYYLSTYITAMCYIQSNFAVGQEVWEWLA